MEFAPYVRKPFTIEAVEITDDNIEEVAKLIGKLRFTPDGKKYIAVNQEIIPNLFQVYPTFWLTKMGKGKKNIRCYSRRIFMSSFVPAEDGTAELKESDSKVGGDDENISDEEISPVVEVVEVDPDAG